MEEKDSWMIAIRKDESSRQMKEMNFWSNEQIDFALLQSEVSESSQDKCSVASLREL